MMAQTSTDNAGASPWPARSAAIALTATVVSAASLVLLHLLNPQFPPSWRMVSEYANGHQAWLLAIVFLAWALASFALLVALRPSAAGKLGKAGLVFLFLAGIGQAMGGVFDINHKLHGPAALIGIPTLCVAAVLLTTVLGRRARAVAPPTWSGQLPWISFVLMLGAFALFASSLKSAGVDMAAQAGPLQELPQGVSGYVGWANRLLFATSYLWIVLTARSVLKG